MPTLPDGAASIFARVTRVTALDLYGHPAVGNQMYVSSALVKATFTPVTEAGDDIAIKNAYGDLAAWYKHGDMVKYSTCSVELATPDPALEAIICGGTIFSDSATALGVPGAPTITAMTTLGTLQTGPYGVRISQFSQYGESLAATEVITQVTGPTGSLVVALPTLSGSPLGVNVYRGSPGQEQLVGQILNFTGQATTAPSGTGAVSLLTVGPLTKPIVQGQQFQIAGDTNSPKIIFTCAATTGIGAIGVPVTASQTVTTTIAAGAINPVFFDTGAITPNGALPIADNSAGPGNYVGYQAPPLGPVANPQGVSLEFFSPAVINGRFSPTYPYWRWVVPAFCNAHIMPRDITNANAQTIMEGQAFENPNWGTGPMGDFQFNSQRWIQRVRCGPQIVPSPSLQPVGAPV